MPRLNAHFRTAFENIYDRLIIGGGMAALFTAYEIMREARDSGKRISLAVIADEIHGPVPSGTHVVHGMDGMFSGQIENFHTLNAMMRQSIKKLYDTIQRENIQCSLHMGYEIKAHDRAELNHALSSVIERGIYNGNEVIDNSHDQVLHLPGHPLGVSIDTMGQLCVPELLDGIVHAIRKMGGQVFTGTYYESHTKTASGLVQVETDNGEFYTRNVPLIATGAGHQSMLADFPVKTQLRYTMALTFDKIPSEDLKHYFGTDKPMAFCDSNLDGDVLWGGIDPKGRVTFGRGEIENPDQRTALRDSIFAQMEDYFPGLLKKYTPKVTFGPMMIAENYMPVIGRAKNYDVMGGWSGRGIVAGYMAAHAYAQMCVHNLTARLQLLENMQAPVFASTARTTPARQARNGLDA